MGTQVSHRYVALNELGYRIGASHHNCTIPDDVVSHIRDLHEYEGVGYRRLAKIFSISRGAVQKICKYRLRAQSVHEWRRVP